VELRTVIVDDNPTFLDAATSLLEREGLTVVGTASSSDGALGKVRELLPDLVLVDVMLGGDSGFELARRLAEVDLGPTVVLISTHAESDFVDLIREAPAAGFVSKWDLSASAIRRILDDSGSATADDAQDSG
jgi:two-component system, NarL family, nitrate/nitrite response regulator NarL